MNIRTSVALLGALTVAVAACKSRQFGESSVKHVRPHGETDLITIAEHASTAAFWDVENEKFIHIPTEGAKIVHDVVEYPEKNGVQIKLRFMEVIPNLNLWDGFEHCKKQGARLPSIRELFDFCAIGVTEPQYGPNFTKNKYPNSARCAGQILWSESQVRENPYNNWLFFGTNDGGDGTTVSDGTILNQNRVNDRIKHGVRCVKTVR
jgi:hypothetical protein